jgi:hypothetical protein
MAMLLSLQILPNVVRVMGSFILMIKVSKAIGYCSSLSIVVSSRECNLGSLFRLSSSFSTLLVVKVFMLSNLAGKSNWHGLLFKKESFKRSGFNQDNLVTCN